MKSTMRLDKMLGNLGFGTRSSLKAAVRQGAVRVNGESARDPGMQIDPERDRVEWNGETVRYQETVYLLLNKPAGVVSATEDLRDRTVLDLLDDAMKARELFPVGRLDKDTEGLLLLTNDGKLAHELLSPRKHVPKTYQALVAGAVGEPDANLFRCGVELDDGYVTMPAHLEVLATVSSSAAGEHPAMAEPYARMSASQVARAQAADTISWIELTIHEGKYHQVKRMFEAAGKSVVYLRRIRMGPLQLDPALPVGKWRELTEEETDSLKQFRQERVCSAKDGNR